MADIFYFRGLLYAVHSGGNSVYIIDVGVVGSNPPSIRQILENQAMDAIRNWKYFMVLKGKLLLVTRYQDHETHRTNGFLVQTLDPKRETWCILGNIDGHAVFVGNNSPIIVNPTTTTGGGGNWECIRNGIYFTDVAPSYLWRLFGHDFGVHDMVEDTIMLGQFSSSSTSSTPNKICDHQHAFFPPDAALTWFTPSPE